MDAIPGFVAMQAVGNFGEDRPFVVPDAARALANFEITRVGQSREITWLKCGKVFVSRVKGGSPRAVARRVRYTRQRIKAHKRRCTRCKRHVAGL